MNRLTKRTAEGHAYLAVTEGMPKEETAIDSSYVICQELLKVFEKLAAYEDAEELAESRTTESRDKLNKASYSFKIQEVEE